MEYASLEALRETIGKGIEGYLRRYPLARFKFASEGEEFFFVNSIHVIIATQYSAYTLEEFMTMLQQISINSLYFHIFDARLRLGRPTNDFSLWLEQQLGEVELAKEIESLDPYAHNLESLR